MSKLKELLRTFPEYWFTDDESVPVLKFTYHGTSCWINIQDDCLEIIPSDSPRVFVALDEVHIDVITHYIPVQLTIGELVAKLTTPGLPTYVPNLDIEILERSFHFFSDGSLKESNLDNIWRNYPNIWTNIPLPGGLTTANNDTIGWYLNGTRANRPLMIPGVPTSVSQLSAVILTENQQDVVTNQYIGASTNLLWLILRPIARMLRRSDEYGNQILRQTDLRNVEGAWLDRWGEIYGVQRIPPENDDEYRRRMVSTTFKPRVSPTSIEKALVDPFAFNSARVYDDTVTPFRFLVEFVATPAQARFFGSHTREVIDLYRAAGTTFSQSGTVVAPREIAPIPGNSFRLRKYYVDSSLEGYSQSEGGVWTVDQHRTSLSPESIFHLFSGRVTAGGLFG